MLKTLCVGLSCIGLVLPASALEAASPVAAASRREAAPQPRKLAADVELDPAGGMHGLVVNAHGLPVAGVPVVLGHMGCEAARTHTDAAGRFYVGRLRGGTYQLAVGEQGRLLRVWAAHTAPPASSHVARIVVGDDVVRGQMPLEDFFDSDAVIICGMVAAMIAIPIAVHNSGPSSP